MTFYDAQGDECQVQQVCTSLGSCQLYSECEVEYKAHGDQLVRRSKLFSTIKQLEASHMQARARIDRIRERLASLEQKVH